MKRVTEVATVLFLILTSACRIGTDMPADELPRLETAEAEDVVRTVLLASIENSVLSSNHVSFMHAHGEATLHSHPVVGPYIHDLQVKDGPQLGHHNVFEFDLSLETPCGGGGSVLIEAVVTGEGNPAVQAGSVHYVMVQTHSDCVVSLSGEEGAEFILNASPYLTVEAHATNDGAGVVTMYGTIEGGIAWEGDAKAGVCEVLFDYTATAPSMEEITEVGASGTFCDLDVDLTVPLG